MKKSAKIAAIALTGIISAAACFSLTACGPKVPEGYTRVGYLISGMTNASKKAYANMIDTYNQTQGNEDKIFVEMIPGSGTVYGQYASNLKKETDYAVATVRDDQIRALMTTQAPNGFVDLETLLTDAQKEQMHYDGIPEVFKNRFRVNSTKSENGKYLVGEGAKLVGIPIGSQPHILFYNTQIFTEWGINSVSVAEDKLEAYNTANGGSLVAHGYAEYKENPLPNASPALVRSKNERNQEVYKVFNNRIPMSWAEQRLLSRFFQKGNSAFKGYDYGYMSEWWYNYVWSVGGDCICWDEATNEYVFSLADKQANYLATETITVNGTTYVQGDVLHHEDSVYLNSNAQKLDELKDSLQELPSTYEAFVEFNRLGVPTTKNVDEGYPGYGVAASTLDNRNRYFTSGKSPFLVEEYQNGVESFKNSAIGKNWDIAPLCQYRLYDNDGVYYNGAKNFANEYLMVIGETYDLDGDGQKDDVYTGEIKTTANETPIVGESASASWGYALCIPAKLSVETQKAAMKFITWVASPEGQKHIGNTDTMIPANLDYALSDEFNDSSSRICNSYAAALVSVNGDSGDYAYFGEHSWIDNWSGMLNGEVRRGEKTLAEFILAKQDEANRDLAAMSLRIKGR